MQKWEYITVGMLNSYGLQYKLNNEKEHKGKEKPLHEVFADLGEEGWELVSFDGESYIFKRPKALAQPGQHAAQGAQAQGHAPAHPQNHAQHPAQHAQPGHPPQAAPHPPAHLPGEPRPNA